MSIQRRTWWRYGIDLLVIVIGILIAFWLNQWAENSKSNQQFQEKIGGVKNEIRRNLMEVDEAYTYHDSLMNLIISNPEKAILRLNPANIQDYSWQIFQNSNLESHLPYEKYALLTEVYSIQSGLEDHNQRMVDLIHLSNIAEGLSGKSINKREVRNISFKRSWIPILEDATAYERILSEKYQEALEQLSASKSN